MFKNGEMIEVCNYSELEQTWVKAVFIGMDGHEFVCQLEGDTEYDSWSEARKINPLEGVKPGQPVLVWNNKGHKKFVDLFMKKFSSGRIECSCRDWDNAEKLPNYNYNSDPLNLEVNE